MMPCLLSRAGSSPMSTPPYGETYNIWTKVARDIDTRKLWRFRSHFYAALESHFQHLGKSNPAYLNKSFKLFWSSGRLFITFENDDHLLLTFSRHLSDDIGDITANFNVLQRFGLDINQASDLITRALSRATEQ